MPLHALFSCKPLPPPLLSSPPPKLIWAFLVSISFVTYDRTPHHHKRIFLNYICTRCINFFFQKDHWWLTGHLGANLARYPQFPIVLGPMDAGNAHHVNNPWGEHILNSDPDARSPLWSKKRSIESNEMHIANNLQRRWCVHVNTFTTFTCQLLCRWHIRVAWQSLRQHQMENVGSTPTVLLDSLLLLSCIKYQVFLFYGCLIAVCLNCLVLV